MKGTALRAGLRSIEGTRLSPRELQVLTLIRDGQTNAQVAGTLFVTEQTVKNQVGSILRKLDVPDRTAAVVTAIRRGFIPLGEGAAGDAVAVMLAETRETLARVADRLDELAVLYVRDA